MFKPIVSAVSQDFDSQFYKSWAYPSETAMTKICAWCGLIMEDGGPVISHGQCTTCHGSMMAELEALNNEPVIVHQEENNL